MPGRDGTGPLGMGPMTGRGMGCCARPFRGARGRGFGSCGWGYAPYAGSGVSDTPVQEKERLAEMERALTEQLAEIRRMQAQMRNPADQE